MIQSSWGQNVDSTCQTRRPRVKHFLLARFIRPHKLTNKICCISACLWQVKVRPASKTLQSRIRCTSSLRSSDLIIARISASVSLHIMRKKHPSCFYTKIFIQNPNSIRQFQPKFEKKSKVLKPWIVLMFCSTSSACNIHFPRMLFSILK